MNKERRDIANSEKVVSISEIVRQIEEGVLDPRAVGPVILQECVVYCSNKGFKPAQIKSILRIDIRMIQRYIERYRKSMKLKLGEDFQQNKIANVSNNIKLRCEKLAERICSENLPILVETQVLAVIHKMQMDELAMLEKFGYLHQSQGEEESIKAHESSVKERQEREALGYKWMLAKKLSPVQLDFIKNYKLGDDFTLPHQKEANQKRLNFIVDKFLEENEKSLREALAVFNVAGYANLKCNVFVINSLCNN